MGGVEPTYKKKRGFAPLQMTWGPFVIDAVLRSGEKHSNHGDDTKKMIRRAVTHIRDKYRQDVPIIVRMDSGYFDQKLFKEMEKLKVAYIVGGHFCAKIKDLIASMPPAAFDRYFGKTDEDIKGILRVRQSVKIMGLFSPGCFLASISRREAVPLAGKVAAKK